MLEAIAYAKTIRDKLRNPVNGRQSSETDVVSTSELRRRRLAKTLSTETIEELELARKRRLDEIIKTAALAYAKRQQDMLEGFMRTPTIGVILTVVARHYLVTVLDIESARRDQSIILPRHVAMYLAKHLTRFSYPQIGRRIGGRDHTSVMSAVKKITRLIENDMRLAAVIDDLKRTLGVA